MSNFIPRKKLSKKAKRALDKSKRVLWEVHPVTQKMESKKHYSRKKVRRDKLDLPDFFIGKSRLMQVIL